MHEASLRRTLVLMEAICSNAKNKHTTIHIDASYYVVQVSDTTKMPKEQKLSTKKLKTYYLQLITTKYV